MRTRTHFFSFDREELRKDGQNSLLGNSLSPQPCCLLKSYQNPCFSILQGSSPWVFPLMEGLAGLDPPMEQHSRSEGKTNPLSFWPEASWFFQHFILLIYKVGPSAWHMVQFSSVQSLSRVRLCDPMNRSMPCLPVHHQLPEFTQTHVHQVGDAIKLSHPLSSPSPPALNPSQHQGLFQWVNSSHKVDKVLEFQPQHQPFQCTPRTGLL